MKYKCYRKLQKEENKGGDYWRDADFDEHIKLTSHQTTYLYLLTNFPPKGQMVLEAGCGIGRWAIPMAQKGYHVTGIDIEQEALEIIKQHYSSDNLQLVKGDIFNMPFSDNSFDIILSLGVLEHFEDRFTQAQAIEEHKRILKEDGIFLVTVPHISIIRLLFHVPFVKLVSLVRYFKGEKEYFTEYRYSRREIENILKHNNLEIIDIVYDDLLAPYNFGLTVDYPINKYFCSKDGIQYKLNKAGIFILKLLWGIHPSIVSGGIGFITRK